MERERHRDRWLRQCTRMSRKRQSLSPPLEALGEKSARSVFSQGTNRIRDFRLASEVKRVLHSRKNNRCKRCEEHKMLRFVVSTLTIALRPGCNKRSA
jgi:hypothetical protein